jgi:hypothetical protein
VVLMIEKKTYGALVQQSEVAIEMDSRNKNFQCLCFYGPNFWTKTNRILISL